ncbi:MAG: hypothetical protein ACT4OP_11635 [Actinomycetota bacterium]
MTQPRGRTRSCGAGEAWDRYLHAQSFLETAELVLEDTTREGYANVSGALAVLAGMAIADSVCCEVFGRRHRGEDHRGASELLRQVAQVGQRMAKDLDRLLAIKDKTSYQSGFLARADARKAVAWARRMIEVGADVLDTGS